MACDLVIIIFIHINYLGFQYSANVEVKYYQSATVLKSVLGEHLW